jgi:hypothetical protein
MYKVQVFGDMTCVVGCAVYVVTRNVLSQSSRAKQFEKLDLKLKATRFFRALATTQPTTKGYS